jgi:hypothetical protein
MDMDMGIKRMLIVNGNTSTEHEAHAPDPEKRGTKIAEHTAAPAIRTKLEINIMEDRRRRHILHLDLGSCNIIQHHHLA